jgi:hypothetical protein
VVGPRVALALGMVNYSEGTASNALLNYIEALIKSMVDDTATLEAINKGGLDAFLKDLLKGNAALKMRKIDFDEARKSIIAEEAVLRSL